MMVATQARNDAVLDVRNLRVTLRTDEGAAQILDDVSIGIRRGEILGVVGESGCGKSTLVKAVLGVLPRTAIVERGSVMFDGTDLLRLDERTLTREIRGSRIGFVPQDPFLALNPVFKVGTQFLELMRWHAPERTGSDGAGRKGRRDADRAALIELLGMVQIADAEAVLERYPHEFSGGQRQRLMIAGALVCRPQLLIADEPTSALDVTTQRHILMLLNRLAKELNVSVIFVTHDFGVVAQLCDFVSVMYAGQSVEYGPTADVLENPRHPYTQMLLRCHPDYAHDLMAIPGSVPSPTDPPEGCRFHPRCPSARSECAVRPPALTEFPGRHTVRCVLYQGQGTTPHGAGNGE